LQPFRGHTDRQEQCSTEGGQNILLCGFFTDDPANPEMRKQVMAGAPEASAMLCWRGAADQPEAQFNPYDT